MTKKDSSDGVFVRGLPQNVTESELPTIFSELKIKRVVEWNAIIDFENTSDEITEEVKKINGKAENKLRVSFAKRKKGQKREVASTSDFTSEQNLNHSLQTKVKECSELYMKYVGTGLHIHKLKKERNKTGLQDLHSEASEDIKSVKDKSEAHIVFYIGKWTGKNKIYYVRSKPNDSDSKEVKADNHAEFLMIQKLPELIPLPNVDTTVSVYISKSPCHMCSKMLILFSKEKRIKFDITFAGLYRCKRRSCKPGDGCDPGGDRSKNEKMLRELNNDDNFHISTFNKRTWNFLKFLLLTKFTSELLIQDTFDFELYLNDNLNIFKDLISERYKEDLKMENDFMNLGHSTDSDDSDTGKVKDKRRRNTSMGKNSTDSDTQSFGEKSKDQENQQIDNPGEKLCKYRKTSSSQKEARLQRSRKVYKRNKLKNNFSRVQLKDNLSSDSESDSDFDSWISEKLEKHQQSESYKSLQKVIKERKSAEYSINQNMEDESILTVSDNESDSDFDSWISEKLEKHQQSESYKSLQNVIKERKNTEYSNNQDLEDESICTSSDSENDWDFDSWISEKLVKHQQSERYKNLKKDEYNNTKISLFT